MFVRQLFLSSRPSLNPLHRHSRRVLSQSITASSRPFSQCSSPAMRSQPRQFPTSGFEAIDPSDKVEEERLPYYRREDYYPMRIGDVIKERYQVVAKLGYGTTSTVWLSRDLDKERYWVLKVYINTLEHNQELNVYQHLAEAEVDADDPGRQHVRRAEDSFRVKGPNGEHDVLIMTPLNMSLAAFQDMQPNKVFQQNLVTSGLTQVLLGLDFLHEAGVIHTDIHPDNLLIGLRDDSILHSVEETEMHSPSPRKTIDDTIIHVSQYMLGGGGPLTISDLGQARIGSELRGPAMPMSYRAPEVILNMPWGKAVDTWATGILAWDLLEGKSLFRVYDEESEEQNDAHHLAAMTALLGPPPPEFLKRSEETKKYWNEEGQWRGPVPLPEMDLQSLASALTGHDKEMFLSYLECVLDWLPEERLKILQVYFHPWLGQKRPPGLE